MNDWTWIALDITSQPKDDLHHEDPWYANVNWVEASRIALALVELGGSGHPSIPTGLGRSVEDGVCYTTPSKLTGWTWTRPRSDSQR